MQGTNPTCFWVEFVLPISFYYPNFPKLRIPGESRTIKIMNSREYEQQEVPDINH